MFHLPLGAWKGRRLFALRAASDQFRSLGIRSGDFIVVEPGPKERHSQIVLARSDQGMNLRRIDHHEQGRDCGSLPLPFPEATGRTIGTVLGVARPTSSGHLRPLGQAAKGPQTQNSRVPYKTRPTKEARGDESPASLERVEELRDQLRAWGAWVDQRTQGMTDGSPLQESWTRLETGLRTLIECLEATQNPRLTAALLREASLTVRTIRGEMARARMVEDNRRLCA